MKRILSIGDIHGRTEWKLLTHTSYIDYDSWRIAVDAGAPADDLEFWNDMPYSKYDKIIFVGDYVDSFDVENIVMKQNLLEIIHFKEVMGDKVVLLLGNHDVQYIVPNHWCSGFRPEMKLDFGEIFKNNLEKFKLAHLEKGSDGSKWLWTHAGVTSGWWKEFLSFYHMKTSQISKLLSYESDIKGKEVDEILNQAWKYEDPSIFDVDAESGGIRMWAGPIWVRPKKLNAYPLDGYNQIVGHTPCHSVWSVCNDDSEGKMMKHFFIDCLEHGDGTGFDYTIL